MAKIKKQNYTAIRRRVKAYLVGTGSYEDIDDVMIEELIFNIELCDIAKQDIKDNGLQMMMTSTKGHEYYQINPAVNVYQSAVKQIAALGTKLGITVLNRTQLGLAIAAADDDLDGIIKS